MIRQVLLACAFSLSVACAPLEDFDARRKVICTSSDIEIFPIGMIHLQVGGTWQAYSHLVNTYLKPKDAPLSDSTAYWLYACEDKGTLVFRTSTKQPDSGLRYMSGNQGCWFVSRFNTDSLGNVVKYTQTDLSFRFAPTSANILMNGSARTITPIDTKPYIPTEAVRFQYVAYINATEQGRYADLVDQSGLDPVRLIDNGVIQSDRKEEFDLIPSPSLGYTGVFAYAVSDPATQLSVNLVGYDM